MSELSPAKSTAGLGKPSRTVVPLRGNSDSSEVKPRHSRPKKRKAEQQREDSDDERASHMRLTNTERFIDQLMRTEPGSAEAMLVIDEARFAGVLGDRIELNYELLRDDEAAIETHDASA